MEMRYEVLLPFLTVTLATFGAILALIKASFEVFAARHNAQKAALELKAKGVSEAEVERTKEQFETRSLTNTFGYFIIGLAAG